MILQALTQYYETLSSQGILDRLGWNKVKISFALELNLNGDLVRIHSLQHEEKRGNKSYLVPREISLPAPVKRSSGIKANFLYDNSSYLLGIDNKDNPKRARDCFEHAKELHLDILKYVQSSCAYSIKSFFRKWSVDDAQERLKESGFYEEIINGANLIFMIDNAFPQEDQKISKAWDESYNSYSDTDYLSRCLITGNNVVPEKTHPSIKGVPNAQSSGAALVSFNAASFCSYGKEQNLNAPIGKYAAFAYTTALNYLLADRDHRKLIGDSVIVFWALNGERAYQDTFSMLMDTEGKGLSKKDIKEAMIHISQGVPFTWEEQTLDSKQKFYVLGIAPNAGRLSIRFFMEDSFGSFVKHLIEHAQAIEIIPDKKTDSQMIPLWRLLKATVNEKSKDKTASPKMAGETLRAILSGGRYPSSLYQQVQLRIKADRLITWERMSIVKAFLLRNNNDNGIKEAMTVELNEHTTYQPYVLGRLFAILEAIQERANPGINATIKDKYFSSASATPGVVFPILVNLKDKHLRKLDIGTQIYYEKAISELMLMLSEDYPVHLSLQDQGVFQIGYYHQRQKRYEKKIKEEQ